MTKFLFPFSLFISYMFLFLLSNPIDLAYVWYKCLAFFMMTCLVVALIHSHLDFFMYFMALYAFLLYGCCFFLPWIVISLLMAN